MFDLTGRSVIVTGGTKGIGRGIAECFLRAGATVTVTGISVAEVDEALPVLAAVSDRVTGLVLDVRDRDRCFEVAAEVRAAKGGIDVLCSNAGVFPQAEIATMTEADIDLIFDINVKGTIFMVQACLDALTDAPHGRIVLTSSITGHVTGYPGWSHYGATKAAQLGFMRTAAIELAPRGITVNAVLPGNIRTEGLDELGEDYLAQMAAAIPAGTLGEPADIGNAAVFLATDEAKYITGQPIIVDGGQILPE